MRVYTKQKNLWLLFSCMLSSLFLSLFRSIECYCYSRSDRRRRRELHHFHFLSLSLFLTCACPSFEAIQVVSLQIHIYTLTYERNHCGQSIKTRYSFVHLSFNYGPFVICFFFTHLNIFLSLPLSLSYCLFDRSSSSSFFFIYFLSISRVE